MSFITLFFFILTFTSSFAIPTASVAPDKDPDTNSITTIMMLQDPGTAILWLFAVLGLVCSLTMAVRIWIRRKKSLLAIDDYLMVVGLVCFIGNNLLACQAVREGVGRADYIVDYTHPLTAVKWVVYWSFGFAITTIPVRASIAMALFKLSMARRYKYIVYILIGVITIVALTQIVWVAQACRPLSYLWDSVDQVGHCDPIDTTVSSIWMFAVASILIDVCIATLPGFFLWNLRLSKARKFQIWLFLASGLVATGATVGRMFFLGAYRDLGFWTTNFYLKFAGVILCSQLEIAFAIFCPSLSIVNQVRDHYARQKLVKDLLPEPRKGKKPTKFFGTTTEVTARPMPTALQKLGNLVTKGKLEDEYVPLPGNEDGILVETTVEVTTEWDFEGAYGWADGRPVNARRGGDLDSLFASAGPSSRISFELQQLPASQGSSEAHASTSTGAAEDSSGARRRQRKNKASRKKRVAKK